MASRRSSSVSRIVTVPAPIGGLNARDSLAAMPPEDAVILENLWPQPYGCTIRKGTAEFAIGFPAAVTSLATWNSATSTVASKLFAWSLTSMYDAVSGTIGAAIVTGLTNAAWQSVSMSNSAGSHLIAVNGADNAILYNNVGVQRLVAGDGIVNNTWNQLNPTNAIQVTVHQGRLWAVEKNTARAWYLPVSQIFGIFTSFDFGPLFSRGGYLQYLATWTLDDGNGAEDHLVAVSSRGEAVVYAGTNPASAATWGLVGVYYVGSPVAGYNSSTKIGGDLALLTQRGVVSMTALLTSTRVDQAEDILKSSKIQFLISEATSLYSTNPGWVLLFVPAYNMLLCNVPVLGTNTIYQFAANEVMPEAPWTKFTGMDAVSWSLLDNKVYFGTNDGRVLEAWTGNAADVKLATAIAVNPNFDVNVTNWTAGTNNTNTWVAGGYNRVASTLNNNLLRTHQTPAADYTGKTLRLTATYRNISTIDGASARVVNASSGAVLASLPVVTGTSFLTNSVDFVCTVSSIRIEGISAVTTELSGTQIEFDSINLTIAPVGQPITFQVQQAYSYLDALSAQKQVGMYRPNFLASGSIEYASDIQYDFATVTFPAAPSQPAAVGSSLWGTGIWGSSLWGGATVPNRKWQQATGYGVAASLLMTAQSSLSVTWISTDYSYKVGALL